MTAARVPSARVYLFADFGKGPRVVKFWEAGESGPGHFRFLSAPRDLVEADFRCLPGSKGSGVIASGIPVWLVECESAEAGRQVIDAASFTESQTIYRKSDGTRAASDGPMPDSYALLGRILASGGAA